MDLFQSRFQDDRILINHQDFAFENLRGNTFADNICLPMLTVTQLNIKRKLLHNWIHHSSALYWWLHYFFMNFSVVIYHDDDPERLLRPGADPCPAISQPLKPCRGASSKTPPVPEIFLPWMW